MIQKMFLNILEEPVILGNIISYLNYRMNANMMSNRVVMDIKICMTMK